MTQRLTLIICAIITCISMWFLAIARNLPIGVDVNNSYIADATLPSHTTIPAVSLELWASATSDYTISGDITFSITGNWSWNYTTTKNIFLTPWFGPKTITIRFLKDGREEIIITRTITRDTPPPPTTTGTQTNWWGWGWWSWWLPRDNCPWWDMSPRYYDRSCTRDRWWSDDEDSWSSDTPKDTHNHWSQQPWLPSTFPSIDWDSTPSLWSNPSPITNNNSWGSPWFQETRDQSVLSAGDERRATHFSGKGTRTYITDSFLMYVNSFDTKRNQEITKRFIYTLADQADNINNIINTQEYPLSDIEFDTIHHIF